jgi:hypothetical protein
MRVPGGPAPQDAALILWTGYYLQHSVQAQPGLVRYGP